MNAKYFFLSKLPPGKLSKSIGNSFLRLAMLGLMLFAATNLFSQNTATLNGTVQDPSGAIVVNAKVQVKNEATGDIRSTLSDTAGFFAVSALPSGDYDVEIESAGFAPLRHVGIHLDPGDTRTVRGLTLAVGGASAQVTVSAGADEAISTDSGEQSSVISASDIAHLSVEGRDATELIKTLPGFTINPSAGSTVQNVGPDPSQVTIRGGSGYFSANGTLQSSVQILYDGVDISDPGDYGGTMQAINYDQVSEVKVSTASFTADGEHGPIVVSAVGKSGGSDYHGALYTYARTNQMDSVDWLAKHTAQGKAPDRQVYPGFFFGGPVRIPGTHFNADKKLTFFIGAEDYAQRNVYAYGNAASALMSGLVPTAAMRQGDFSPTQLQAYLGPSYQPIQGAFNCNGTYANVCYLPQAGPQGQALNNGNIGAFLDPGAMQIVNDLWPLPNVPSTGQYNWIQTDLIDNDEYQAKGRVDYAINDNHKLFVTFSNQTGLMGAPQLTYYSDLAAMGGVNSAGGGLLENIHSDLGSVNLASILSPTLTNEFYFGGAFSEFVFTPKNFLAVLGGTPNGYLYQGLWNNGSKALPWLEDWQYDLGPLALGPDPVLAPPYVKKGVRMAGDNLTKVLASHTLRAGAFFQMVSNHQTYDSSSTFQPTNGAISQYYIPETIPNYTSNGTQNGTLHATGAMGSYSGGNYLADFMEGQVFAYSQSNFAAAPNLYFFNFSGYLQDHWRTTRRLSIDAGVRFEHLTPWADAQGVGAAVWDPATYNNPVSAVAPGFVWHAIHSQTPVGGFPTRLAFVEPRAGFALDLYGSGKTVLRGGFGLYEAQESSGEVGNEFAMATGMRNVQVNYVALSQVSYLGPSVTGGPGGFTPDANVNGIDGSDDKKPETYTWNVAIDQRLPMHSFFEVAYVGNHSDHLMNSPNEPEIGNVNALPIGALYGPQPGTGTVYPLLPPAGSTSTNNSVGNLDQAHLDSFRQYPGYEQIVLHKHFLYSNYDGLQVSLNKQQGRLRYAANYTWSKALGIVGATNAGVPTNVFNLRDNYQSLPFDRHQVFNATYSYDFGTFIKRGWIGYVTNGWELSGITNFQSGTSMQSINNSNFGLDGTMNLGQGSATPTQIGVSNIVMLGTQDVNLQPVLTCNPAAHGSHRYFNAGCFALNPTVGQNGTYRFPFIAGPAYTDSDLTAAKSFKVTDKSNLQFRMAAFNFINHANTTFASLDESAYTLNFNNSTSSMALSDALSGAKSQNQDFGYAPLRVGRRIMELSLKYNF